MTSPEVLYNVSQLKEFATHDKNCCSPDIRFVHDRFSQLSDDMIHQEASHVISVVHEDVSVIHEDTSDDTDGCSPVMIVSGCCCSGMICGSFSITIAGCCSGRRSSALLKVVI